jgi:hypothetical protein
MSATYSRSGHSAAKARSTSPRKTRTPGTRIVVRRRFTPRAPTGRRRASVVPRACARRARRRRGAAPRGSWERHRPDGLAAWISRIRPVRRSSSRARADGSRRHHACNPERLTPSTRHIVLTACSALFAAMNSNTVTESCRRWRRRPRPFQDVALFGQHPVLAAQPPQLLALVAGQPCGLALVDVELTRPVLSDCGEHPSSRASCGIVRPLERTTARLPDGTPTNTAGSMASTDILPGQPHGSAVRCPRDRGNSKKLNRRGWPTRQAARNAVFAWTEGLV